MKTVSRNGKRYYCIEDKDIQLPSVTTILGSMTDKSGIDAWRAKVGDEVADRISKNAANRGTFMHLLCENYLRKRFEEKKLDTKSLLKETFLETLENVEISKFTRSQLSTGKDLFMNFYQDKVFDTLDDVIIQEVALWSTNGGGYAGRVDLIARLVDNTICVIDFKSSTKPKKKQWIENYFYQASAYAFAFYERYGEMPLSAEIWISNEANQCPQIFKMNLDDLKKYYKEFIGLVKGYHEKFS